VPRWNAAAMAELFTEVRRGGRGPLGLAVRRAVMTLFALVSLLGLVGAFGQRSTASSNGDMTVTMPSTVRGGLFWQARIDIRATRTLRQPRLVFADGWLEGMQVNSIEPAAQSESSRDGRLVLSYDKLEPGDRLQIWMQFEVDPTNLGHRSVTLELDDGTTPVARTDRDIRVLP
jgi:hypothetical protein